MIPERKTSHFSSCNMPRILYIGLKPMFFLFLSLWGLNFPFLLPPSAVHASGFQLMGHFGGMANVILVQGDYLYAGLGSELAVFDVRRPQSPVRIGSVMLPSNISQIEVVENRAYLTDANQRFWIVDLSNPADPEIMGNYTNVPNILDFAVLGDYAYLSWHKVGLAVIDVSDPQNLREVGVWNVSGSIGSVDSVGGYLYVSQVGKILILDVSNSPVISEVGSLDAAPIAESLGGVPTEYSGWAVPSVVMVQDQFALLRIYISYGHPAVAPTDFLVACDISDPLRPAIMGLVNGYYTVADGGFAAGVKASCSPRVGCWGSVFSIYSFSDPQNPQAISSYYSERNVYSIAIKAPYLYVADSEGLWSVNINQLDFASPVWSISPETFWGVSAANVTNVLIASDKGVRFADFSDVTAPVVTGPQDYGLRQGDCFVFSPPLLYAVRNSSTDSSSMFTVLDLSDQLVSVEVASLAMDNQAKGIAVDGGRVYVAMGQRGLLDVDVSSPSVPAIVGSLASTGWSAEAVAVEDGYAFVAAGGAGLRIVNVNSPFGMREVGALVLSKDVVGVAVQDGILYVAAEQNLLKFDISDPPHPAQFDQYYAQNQTAGLSAAGDLVFMVAAGKFKTLRDSGTVPIQGGGMAALPFAVATGDFDRDGKADLLRYDSQTREVDIFLSREGTFIQSPTLRLTDMDAPDVYAVGDFDGNGYFDVLWHRAGNNTAVVYVSDGVSFTRSPTLLIGSLGRPDAYAVGDFDDNGCDDLLWYENWNGNASFFVSDGHFLGGAPERLGLSHPDALTVGNFDGKGGDDLMWYSVLDHRSDFYLSESAVFYRWNRMAFEGFGPPDAYAVGDYNGDGLDDILWYEAWSGRVQVYASHGAYFVPETGLEIHGLLNPVYTSHQVISMAMAGRISFGPAVMMKPPGPGYPTALPSTGSRPLTPIFSAHQLYSFHSTWGISY